MGPWRSDGKQSSSAVEASPGSTHLGRRRGKKKAEMWPRLRETLETRGREEKEMTARARTRRRCARKNGSGITFREIDFFLCRSLKPKDASVPQREQEPKRVLTAADVTEITKRYVCIPRPSAELQASADNNPTCVPYCGVSHRCARISGELSYI